MRWYWPDPSIPKRWFAWRPVLTECGHVIWLEYVTKQYVRRKYISVHGMYRWAYTLEN